VGLGRGRKTDEGGATWEGSKTESSEEPSGETAEEMKEDEQKSRDRSAEQGQRRASRQWSDAWGTSVGTPRGADASQGLGLTPGDGYTFVGKSYVKADGED